MALEIKKGVPRPKNLRKRNSGEVKYPLADMEVDDCVEVPKSMYEIEPYDAQKHRNRVNQSARNYALKMNKEAMAQEGFDPQKFVPMRFTVAIQDDGETIGIWRDS